MDQLKLNQHHKLSGEERDLIAVWFNGGHKIRKIARRLSRSPATISEEIERNSFTSQEGQRFYVAIKTQSLSEERKQRSRRKSWTSKSWVYAYVLEKLSWGWSPEQIAGRPYSPTNLTNWLIESVISSGVFWNRSLRSLVPSINTTRSSGL